MAAAEDLSPSGALELKNFIERSNSLCHLPVVLLGEAEASLLAHPDAGLPALLSKFDREALLGSVRKLAEALEPAGVPAKLNTPTEQVQ